MINMLEGKEQEPDTVSLSTLHAAKGLEFPHVFIIGAEEEILPFRDSDEKQIRGRTQPDLQGMGKLARLKAMLINRSAE